MRLTASILATWLQLSAVLAKKPNIVFVLTDDQDLHLQSMDYVPLIKKHLADKGTSYKRHYCTTSQCCPSRVTLWTGKLAHNTNVTDVLPPWGGYPKFVDQGLNENWLPVWLQEAGYDTYYTGKLFNSHSVDNYDKPFPAGWTGSDFLLDPFTYAYMTPWYQRNREPPVAYDGINTQTLISEKALGFLDDAISNPDKPFFIGIAPIAPHSNMYIDENDVRHWGPPIPLDKHAHLFPDAQVPRTPNFNPDVESGGSWVRGLRKQDDDVVEYNDHYYRERLRSLQSVDELVDDVIKRLEAAKLLDNTYIIYTSDNGFHIGQHRMQPGKMCGYEEDINVPLIIRGPGVPKGEVSNVVTAHVDLAPTIMQLAGIPLRDDFDGAAIPLTKPEQKKAVNKRQEHVTVEFWGMAYMEGGVVFRGGETDVVLNNTYKSLRVIDVKKNDYNFYYSIWCNNEHELYDMKTDPYQMTNLLHPTAKPPKTILGRPFEAVVARLDALLFVLKSCKQKTCVEPWRALHPAGNVDNLKDALNQRFDDFYIKQQKKVRFERCEAGLIIDAEGPQFETDGLLYRDGSSWSEWT
ncbi:hypothetical protein QC762_208050 [Podospora pseudocomata]|uniref:Arylsulfatase n=1 Tax=Podospora pseudocomata TaxID=2093779 RepID=A0ABR0GAD8_9PEZI|nr:hypothetical protein QC762_208050 [Podospora pseudocomata]